MMRRMLASKYGRALAVYLVLMALIFAFISFVLVTELGWLGYLTVVLTCAAVGAAVVLVSLWVQRGVRAPHE